MKKLRTSAQIHAQIPVHGSEATGKLEAGIAVMTPDNATGKSTTQFRYDVYFLTLFLDGSQGFLPDIQQKVTK